MVVIFPVDQSQGDRPPRSSQSLGKSEKLVVLLKRYCPMLHPNYSRSTSPESLPRDTDIADSSGPTLHPYALRDRTNVMEILVAEETDRQLRRCPSALLNYVKAVEVETYALNRLPPLYAASHEGLEYQKERAHQSYGAKIQTVVRQAFAAIQQDPLRRSTPLVTEDDRTHHQRILELATQFPTLDDLNDLKQPHTPSQGKEEEAAIAPSHTSPPRTSHTASPIGQRTAAIKTTTKGDANTTTFTDDFDYDRRVHEAARYRRSHLAQDPSHRRTKASTANAATGVWDDYRYTL